MPVLTHVDGAGPLQEAAEEEQPARPQVLHGAAAQDHRPLITAAATRGWRLVLAVGEIDSRARLEVMMDAEAGGSGPWDTPGEAHLHGLARLY